LKIYCASDFHLGLLNAKYSKIKDFLYLVQDDADQLVLLGDILDLWVCKYNNIKTMQPMKDTYDLLIETAKEVPTVYVSGNHDFNIAHLNRDFLITDHFSENNIYFTHGSEFDPEQALGKPFYNAIEQELPDFYNKYFIANSGLFDVFESLGMYINFVNEAAQYYANWGNYDYIIYGHTHYPMLEGKLVNCGDFISHCNYVVIKNGIPVLNKLGEKYELS
jgi:UDP-2,3-diacylglucosamine pyrophosphatase LpxH